MTGSTDLARSGPETQGSSEEPAGRMALRQDVCMPTSHQELPPTAQKLLVAARTVLERSGYEGLRLEAISKESGLAHSLIRYHFGGKAGLVAALADWLFYETYDGMHRSFAEVDECDSEGKLRALSPGLRRLFDDRVAYQLYFDLIIAGLHDKKMRPKLADMFQGQRELLLEVLDRGKKRGSQGTPTTVATIIVAFCDGLALQFLCDPPRVDIEGVFAVWDKMLACAIAPESPEGV